MFPCFLAVKNYIQYETKSYSLTGKPNVRRTVAAVAAYYVVGGLN
jgi:hypothetical protein